MIENKEESTVFDKLDIIRFGEGSDTEINTILKDLSCNYDIDLLESLEKDISLYLSIEREDKECQYSSCDIEKAINERLSNGLDIPYKKTKQLNELTESQLKVRKRLEDRGFKHDYSSMRINTEELLFPFEFYNIYCLQRKIINKITESNLSKNESLESGHLKSFHFENNFDSLDQTVILEFFTEKLVKTKYLKNEVLENYLILAFDKREIPEVRFNIENLNTKDKIIKIFYEFYKVTAGKPRGKQIDYAKLLGEYFTGFDTKTVSSNFSK